MARTSKGWLISAHKNAIWSRTKMNPRGGCQEEGRHQFPSLSRIDLPRLDAPPTPLFSYLNLNNQSPITKPQPPRIFFRPHSKWKSPPPLIQACTQANTQVFPSPPSRTLHAKTHKDNNHVHTKESKSCQEGKKQKRTIVQPPSDSRMGHAIL